MRLSYSQLALFSRCPKQYEYTFDLRYTRKISAGESFGSSIHNTLKKWGELEMSMQKKSEAMQLNLFGEEKEHTKSPLTITTLLTLFRESFIAEGYESEEHRKKALERGKKALEHWYNWWKKEERTILACEESFAIQTNNGTIAGRFDRIEKTRNGIKIIDFKTSVARSEEELHNDLQLTLYVYAGMERWNTKNIDVSLLILSEKECQEQCTKRTENDLQIMLERVKETSEHILQKKFTATPSTEKCMHCPYRNICKSAKKVPLPPTGTL